MVCRPTIVVIMKRNYLMCFRRLDTIQRFYHPNLSNKNIRVADPIRHPGPADMDPYQFLPNLKINYRYFFQKKIQIPPEILKIMTPMTMKETKQCNWHCCECK